MSHVIARSRRTVIAAAIAGLLGAAALLAVSPSPAAAAKHKCPPAEFCLYFNEDANGGFYHFEGSDSNLNNDRYEGGDKGETVGNTARYAWNNGRRGRLSDVIVYGRPGFKGPRDCIERGDKGPLPRRWWNNIESYRWVTRSVCEKAEILEIS